MASGINGYPGYVTDCVRGDTHKIKVQPTFVDENGVIQDITLSDYEFHLDIDSDLDSSTTAELSIVVAAGDNLDSSLKSVTIVINATQSGGLTAGEKYYQITMINASDSTEAHVLDMGKITVMERV